MDTIFDHIDVQTLIQDAFAQPADLSIGLCLIDDEQVPVDVRTRRIASTEYLTGLTGTPLAFASTYFGQDKRPATLMLGRWVATATPAYYVGAAYTAVYGDFEAVSDSSFGIAVEGINAGALTQISAIDFTGDASIADVLATLNTELHTQDTASYADYDFAVDAMGRFYVYNPDDPGAASAAVTIGAGSTGTDLTVASLLNMASGTAVDGLDVEEPLAALQAAEASDPGWYMLAIQGASTAQNVVLSTTVNGMRKMALLTESAAAAKDAALTTDLGYQVSQLAHKRTVAIFSENATEYPDAAFMGHVLPRTEGVSDWAWKRLFNVTASGNPTSLTSAQKTALDGKKYAYFETVDGITSAPYVFVASGTEARLIRGVDWFNTGITTEIFNAHINAELFAFDAQTIGIIVGIVTRYCREAIRRGIGVDTEARPLVINAPDADDYTATQRASHTLEMVNLFTLHLNSAVHDIAIDGTWTLN